MRAFVILNLKTYGNLYI